MFCYAALNWLAWEAWLKIEFRSFMVRNFTTMGGAVIEEDEVMADFFRGRSWTFDLFRDRTFRSGHFGLSRFGLAVSVTGHFGQTMISCRNLTLMQTWAVWFKAHSRHHLTVGYQRSRHYHSKGARFTIRNSGKRSRQGILLGIKFFVVVQSNWISGDSGLAEFWLRFIKL